MTRLSSKFKREAEGVITIAMYNLLIALDEGTAAEILHAECDVFIVEAAMERRIHPGYTDSRWGVL